VGEPWRETGRVKPIPVAFHVGPLVVHTYGIGLALTFWFAYCYAERRFVAQGWPTAWLPGAFVSVLIAAIVGARMLHVLANLSYYRAAPSQIPQIWHGGLSSYGGLLLGVPTGILVFRRRVHEISVLEALDALAPVLVAAWGVGRLLGPQLMYRGGGHPTTQWFGMYYAGQAGKRLPVPIFQALDCFGIFLVLLVIERRVRERPTGLLLSIGAGLWGLARFFEEHLWLAEPGHLGAVLVQVAGLTLFGAGLVASAVLVARHHRLAAARRPVAIEDEPASERAEVLAAPEPSEEAGGELRA
jgi:phosphatidylglycerol:prolipoprotein diacylglycerol transferase